MRVKTSELTGAALDWAAGIASGKDRAWVAYCIKKNDWKPSTDWLEGGPIIEREGITIQQSPERDCWMAHNNSPASEGHTPLVAAMRCFVASKLGDEVEIPEELL